MPVALVEQVDKLEDVAGVAEVRNESVTDVVMRTFSHKYIKLTEMQKQDAIDYFVWLKSQHN